MVGEHRKRVIEGTIEDHTRLFDFLVKQKNYKTLRFRNECSFTCQVTESKYETRTQTDLT